MSGLAITQLNETLRVHGTTVDGFEQVIKEVVDRAEYYSIPQIKYSIDLFATHIVQSYMDGNECLVKDPQAFYSFVEMLVEKFHIVRNDGTAPEWGLNLVMQSNMTDSYKKLGDDAVTQFALEMMTRHINPVHKLLDNYLDPSVKDFIEL